MHNDQTAVPTLVGIPGSHPYLPDSDITALLVRFEEILRSGVLTKGKFVEAFEQSWGRRHDTDAISLANATIGLEAIFRAVGVAGGEVVVPANTFVATASAAANAGARVRFVDIDLTTLAPTPAMMEKAIGPNTKLVVLCHMGGLISADTPALVELCTERGVPCVEDAAQALGVTLDGRLAGTFGSAAVFSLFSGKIITAGEGGMIVTQDAEIAALIRALRDQGRDPDGVYRQAGHNWRMTEFQAALGGLQLSRLDEIIATRSRTAGLYTRMLSDVPGLTRPIVHEGVRPNWYKYWIELATPKAAAALAASLEHEFGLRQAGPLQGHREPCHLMPAFAASTAACPNAEHFCASHVGLPMFTGIDDAAVNNVAAVVRTILARES